MAGNTRTNNLNRSGSDDLRTTKPDANPDPITGAPGSHPIGTGIGAAAAGAAGAAIGTVVPGVGTVIGGAVGAVVGAVAGALAGHGIAEAVNPSLENDYWRQNYATRPYAATGSRYEDYEPAYRYGWESRSLYCGRGFDDVEGDLRGGWDKYKGKSPMTWDKARDATRDAWNRLESKSTRSEDTGVRTANPRTSDMLNDELNDPDQKM